MRETRIWIGQSKSRDRQRRGAGGSQFFVHYRPGTREAISRELLVHGMVSLHALCLVEHERRVYEYGHAHGLDLPVLVEARGTTVTTELIGPSVRMLLERSDLPAELTEDERAAIVVNTLRCAAPLADAGMVPLDGHLHNWWVHLEDSLRGGHLDFRRVLAGDHSYTLVRGQPFDRPLWCSAEMAHFPPEARVFKRADEDAFAAELRGQGFEGASLAEIVRAIAHLPGDHDRRAQRWRLERAYEEHRSPQQLEAALESGAIEPHRMIQFCLGRELLGLLERPHVPLATARILDACAAQLRRMADPRPESRFDSIGDAAEALRRCWPQALPDRSLVPWPAIEASWLIWDVRGGTDPTPTAQGSSARPRGESQATFELGSGSADEGRLAPAWSFGNWTEALRRFPKEAATGPRRVVAWLVGRPVHVAVVVAIVVSLIAGIRLPQSPEQAASYQRRAQIERWARQAVAADPRKSAEAIRHLSAVASDPASPEHDFAKSLIERTFSQLEVRQLSRPLVRAAGAVENPYTANQSKTLRALEGLAATGHEESRRWLKVLRDLSEESRPLNAGSR